MNKTELRFIFSRKLINKSDVTTNVTHVQSKQWNQQNNLGNMLKVNKQDSRIINCIYFYSNGQYKGLVSLHMYLSQFAYVRASKSIFYETIMHCQVKLRKNRCKSVRAWKRRKIFGHSRKENRGGKRPIASENLLTYMKILPLKYINGNKKTGLQWSRARRAARQGLKNTTQHS